MHVLLKEKKREKLKEKIKGDPKAGLLKMSIEGKKIKGFLRPKPNVELFFFDEPNSNLGRP